MEKIEIEKELSNIMRLYKACLDKDYLRELCSEKGLLKKANQIIESHKNRKSFEERYSELLKENASNYLKSNLLKEFVNKSKKIAKNEDEEELEEDLEELEEKIDELDPENLARELDKVEEIIEDINTPDGDKEKDKKLKKQEVGDVSYYQKALQLELEKAFNLKWEPNFEIISSGDSSKKIRGAYVKDGIPHLYYGEGSTIKDIGSKIYFKVRDAINNLGIMHNKDIDPSDIAHDVAKLVVYGSSGETSSLVKAIQKYYDKAAENKKLPLNISPFIMTIVNSRIGDVIKLKSNYLKKLYDNYVYNEKYKKNNEEIDKLEKSLRTLDMDVENLEKEFKILETQLGVRIDNPRLRKRKVELTEKLEELKDIRLDYSETLNSVKNKNKSIKNQIDDLQKYVLKVEKGLEEATGLETVKKAPDVDSEGEFKDIYEEIASSYSADDLFSEKTFTEYDNFKSKFKPYYEKLFLKNLYKIISENPNIKSKNDIKDFIELAFDPIEIEKDDDGNIDEKKSITNLMSKIPDPHLLDLKEEVLGFTFELITELKQKGLIDLTDEQKEDQKYESFKKKLEEIKSSADKQFTQFLQYDLPEKIFKEYLDFFKNFKSGISSKEKELYIKILNLLYYGKDENLQAITIKDRQKIIEYFGDEESEDYVEVNQSQLNKLTQAVKVTLMNFGTKGNNGKGYPKIIERLYVWDLLPKIETSETRKNTFSLIFNKDEMEELSKNKDYIPERFKKLMKNNKEISKEIDDQEELEDKFETYEEKLRRDIVKAENILDSLKNKTTTLVEKEMKELDTEDMSKEEKKKERSRLRSKAKSELKNNFEVAEKNLKNLYTSLSQELNRQIFKLDGELKKLKENLKSMKKEDSVYQESYNLYKNLIDRKENFLSQIKKDKEKLDKSKGIKLEELSEEVKEKPKKTRTVKKSSVEDITKYIDTLYRKIII